MLNKNVYDFIGCDCEYDTATTVIFGAPFDGTVSYRPGSRFAPARIRQESYGIETFSPYQQKDLTDYKICDNGDLDLPFGNTQKVLDMIYNQTKTILADNKFPLLIGGEHLVSLGAIKASAQKHKDLHIIHFDAHTDLREDYLGEKLSHATVIKRAYDIVGDNKIFQFCIRSGEREEFEFAKKHTHLTPFNFDGLDECIQKINNKPVYLTIDLDCIDPSEFPGTGTPEAGGVSFIQTINAIKKLSCLNIIGADIVELSPTYDASGISTALACKILRELLLAVQGEE